MTQEEIKTAKRAGFFCGVAATIFIIVFLRALGVEI